jgi:hypothetical protein
VASAAARSLPRRHSLLIWVLLCGGCGTAGPPEGPLNAAYEINGRSLRLEDGRFTEAAAPGSATRRQVTLVGDPVQGALQSEGVRDAALVLVIQEGGSGSFQHVAAALADADTGTYRGTNTVLLGDRVQVGPLEVRNRLLVIPYREHGPGVPFAETPEVERRRFAWVRDQRLLATEPEDTRLGRLVIGHEVRSFEPCGSGEPLWLLGNSPALPALRALYDAPQSGTARPYAPLRVTLRGARAPAPSQGFGAAYAAAYLATAVIDTSAESECE